MKKFSSMIITASVLLLCNPQMAVAGTGTLSVDAKRIDVDLSGKIRAKQKAQGSGEMRNAAAGALVMQVNALFADLDISRIKVKSNADVEAVQDGVGSGKFSNAASAGIVIQ